MSAGSHPTSAVAADGAPAVSPELCFSVRAIAERLGGRIEHIAPGGDDVLVRGVNAMADATADQITFISDDVHARHWPASRGAAAVVSQAVMMPNDPHQRPVVRVDNAELASFALLEMFQPPLPRPEVGVHPTAWVHPTVRMAEDVRIGPHVSVDADCVLGEGVTLHAGVRLYPQVTIGAGTELHANVVIRERCTLGCRVLIHQNASIGADGFGFRLRPDGMGLMKAPHIGTVIIEDDVEIGANSCVDRAKFGATIVGMGTKMDNQAMVGHNSRVGRHCIIVGQVGIGGSVVIEDGVVIGGQVGVTDHCRIGAGARIGAQSGIMKDVPPGAEMFGSPAEPAKDYLRMHAVLRTLASSRSRQSRQARRRSDDGASHP